MNDITVKKDDLIKKLKDNRKEHRSIFEKAMEGWHKQCIAVLDKERKRAEANQIENLYVRLETPEDHTADYDRRIEMYEMALEDEIVMSEREFAMYVQDDWDWQRQFLSSNIMYTDSASAKLSDLGS